MCAHIEYTLYSGHVDWKVDTKDLDEFGRALVQANHDNGSWRQKLEYIKNLFHEENVAKNAGYLSCVSFSCAHEFRLQVSILPPGHISLSAS